MMRTFETFALCFSLVLMCIAAAFVADATADAMDNMANTIATR